MENEANNDEHVELSPTATTSSTMISTENNEDGNEENDPTIEKDQEEEEEEEEKQCYICWEGSTTTTTDDESSSDHEIRRDCGCIGSSGWVHTSCLIELAESRTPELSDPLLRPWSTCSQCTQPYKEPTKSLLENRLLGSGGRHKRLWKGFQSVSATLLFTCLYFGIHSLLGCSIMFFGEVFGEHLVVTWVERLEPVWEASSEKIHMTIYFVATCVLGLLIYEYRWQIWRITQQVATIWSALFIIGAPFLVEPDEINTMEFCAALSVCIGIISLQLYQARGVIRHELLQIQRRGVLAALMQIVFLVFLFHLHGYIDEFVYSQFDKHVVATTSGYNNNLAAPSRTSFFLTTRNQKLEELLEYLRALERQVEEQVQLRQQEFRDDYLYWTCCD